MTTTDAHKITADTKTITTTDTTKKYNDEINQQQTQEN